MRYQTAQAIYTNGKFIFADPAYTPRSGTEVVVTYVVQNENVTIANTLKTLRGRGKGENLVEKLLQMRREDRELVRVGVNSAGKTCALARSVTGRV